MKMIRWNLIVFCFMAVTISMVTLYSGEVLAKGSYSLTSFNISFANPGPRIYDANLPTGIPVKISIISPRKQIDNIVLQSRGIGSRSNVYGGEFIRINGPATSGGVRINVSNAQRVEAVVAFHINQGMCGKNTLYASAWVKGGGRRVGSPSNALTFWVDCEQPQLQVQLKRMDGSVLGGVGHNNVSGRSLLLEVNARDDQGIKDIVVREQDARGRLLASRQVDHGLVKNLAVQFRIPVPAYDPNYDPNVQGRSLYVHVNDWADGRYGRNGNVRGATTSVSYRIDPVIARMDSVPRRVAAGQSVRITGQFNQAAFNAHRVVLSMVAAGSRNGFSPNWRLINGTTLEIRLANTLPIGRYTLSAEDSTTHSRFGQILLNVAPPPANRTTRAARVNGVSASRNLASGGLRGIVPGLHSPAISSYSRTRVRPGNILHVTGVRLGARSTGVTVLLQHGSSRIRVTTVSNWRRDGTGFDIALPAAPPGRYRVSMMRNGKTTNGPERLTVVR